MSHGKLIDTPVPQALADAEILDEHGGTIRLGSLWADHAVVLAFVRHFG